MIATTPPPPYYAVIFISVRTEGDRGYAEMSKRMLDLARQQPGFLGVESAREAVGITISYWRDLPSIQQWRTHAEHTIARQRGKADWYRHFRVRIAHVQREYGM